MITSTQELDKLREEIQKREKTEKKSIRVCIGTGCAAKGSFKLYELFKQAAAESEADVTVEAKCVGCHGFCERGPIVAVEPGNIIYQGVDEPDVAEIFRETILQGQIIDRLLYEDPETGKKATTENEIPFYSAQHRIVLAENGRIDPKNIEDYIANGGYAALAKALTAMEPEEIVKEIEVSGLRGRGGGGFPTGRKWRTCREAPGERRFVICNGDEGDPGAFMDRSIMEGNPHRVIEGIIIGGYAVVA